MTGVQTCALPILRERADDLGRGASAPVLLPGFDEFILGYQDRLFAMTAEQHHRLVPGNNGVFKRAAIRRGEVVGTWGRSGGAGKRKLALQELADVSDAQRRRFEKLFRAFPYTVV